MHSNYLEGHHSASLHQFCSQIPSFGATICGLGILMGVFFKRCEYDGKRFVAVEGEDHQK